MNRTPSVVAIIAMVLVVSACADDAGRSQGAEPDTSTTLSNIGGDVVPAQRSSEEYPHVEEPIAGIVDLRDDGCWTVDIGSGPRIAILPVDFELTVVDDLVAIGLPGERPITSGMAIAGTGGTTPAASLPGGADGFWGNYLMFCEPAASEVVVIDTIEPASQIADLTTEELKALVRDADLADSWPCGLGFSIASPDQRVALYLFPVTESIDPPITFPNPAWEGVVVVGSDLLVNHCDDVVEPDEPERIVAAEWPITEGTLTFSLPDDDIMCGSLGDVEAVLTGAVIDTGAGTIALDDLSMVNTAYGCFAG